MLSNFHVLLKLVLHQARQNELAFFLVIIKIFIHVDFQFEALYKAAHAAIRADPSPSPKKVQKADAAKVKR